MTTSTLSHSGTAILLNDGKTAYAYDHGYYVSDAYLNEIVDHVELHDSDRAIAKSCEFLEDGTIVIFGEGRFVPYTAKADEDKFDYDKYIADFIFKHEAIGECTLEEWEHFSDIYKDARGIRPRFGNYKFYVI